MLTLLEIVQNFCKLRGLPVPLQVATALDKQTLQMLALLNQELDYIIQRWRWQGQNIIGSWTTLNQEDQASIYEMAPFGFVSFVKGTLWDQTQRLPLYGPLTPQQWELLKSLPQTGPFYQYRINRDRFLMNPAPPVNHTLAFEYNSKWGVLATDGTTYKRYFTEDTDTPVIVDTLFSASLRWRWGKEKGLDYAEDFREYEEIAANAFSTDGTKPTLSMDGTATNIRPGIMVPLGSWNV